MNVWFYGAGKPQTRDMQSLEFFAKSGIATTGSPWDGQTCARNWATVGKTARERGLPYLGALYTSWDDRWGALEATAVGAWKTKD